MVLTRTIDEAKIVELDITKFDSHCYNIDNCTAGREKTSALYMQNLHDLNKK